MERKVQTFGGKPLGRLPSEILIKRTIISRQILARCKDRKLVADPVHYGHLDTLVLGVLRFLVL